MALPFPTCDLTFIPPDQRDSNIRHSVMIAILSNCSATQLIESLLRISIFLCFVGFIFARVFLIKALRQSHEETFSELGQPRILGVSDATPPDYGASNKLLWFICSTRYRDIGDKRVSMPGHAALVCIVLFFGFIALSSVL